MKTFLNFLSGTVLTTIIYILGGLDFALKALLIMIVLDYITGICKAIINKNLNSKIGVKGIIKKVGYLVIVALSVILDQIMGNSGAIRNIVIYSFITNEGISILENWSGMGLKLPGILEKLKK